jgi:hypothetical protein
LLSENSLNQPINRIYYFSTQEGLLSHLFQLQILWYASLPYHSNAKFILVPWWTHHFPGVHSVSLCDYFLLPEVFVCEPHNRPYDKVAASLPASTVCELMNASFGTDPGYYKLQRNQVKIVDQFHFDGNPSCIGGFLGFYPGGASYKVAATEVIMPWKFRYKYIQQLNLLKQKTGLLMTESSNNYLVVHWRRGDQLKSDVRCAQPLQTASKSGTSPVDTSVNCGSVERLPLVYWLNSAAIFCQCLIILL